MDPIVLRFIERITAVLIGALAIYLGFLLFRLVPRQRDSEGKVTLPFNTSIAVTRVGPGVLFALFGIVSVGLSLLRPIHLSEEQGAAAPGGTPTRNVKRSYFGSPVIGDVDARADARAKLRRDMDVLNTIPRQLRADLSPGDRGENLRSLARVKLALLEQVWGTPEEGFGDFARFKQWVLNGEQSPPPDGMDGALALYRHGQRGGAP